MLAESQIADNDIHRLCMACLTQRNRNPFTMRIIILIAWLYVVLLLAAGSGNLARAINVFLFLGVIPVGLMLWVSLRKVHQRQRALREAREQAAEADQAE